MDLDSKGRTSLTGQLLEKLAVVPLPRDRDAATLHLLDWLGCALAGVATNTGRAMALAGGTKGYPLSSEGRSIVEFAFALGSFGSLLEMDDVHRTAILHPGPVIWPAIIACATMETSDRAPEAALRGYEAMIRLGQSVGQDHYAHFHNTSTCGGLGSAVAAAWMFGLDQKETLWAMAHALSISGGLWECRNEVGATKHLHVAEAARRGVQAALAAQAGIAGPLHILEGAQGFYAGLAPGGSPQVLLAGAPWALHDTSFKPWPACRHTHPVIDAALAWRGSAKMGNPDRIVIETYADAVLFCDCIEPNNPEAARFSLQHAVAVSLIDGPPRLSAFEGDALVRPDYRAIRQICEVIDDKAMTTAYPNHFGARLRVTVDRLETVVHVPDAWGDIENPISAKALFEKFKMLAASAGIDPGPLQDAALNADTGAFALRGLLAVLPATQPKEN